MGTTTDQGPTISPLSQLFDRDTDQGDTLRGS
jgi:hypothetical protein